MSSKPTYDKLEAKIHKLEEELAAREKADKELKRMDDELLNALGRIRFHVENTPLAVVGFNHQYQITQWSKRAEAIFGWSAEEVLGRKIGELRWVHQEDVQRVADLSADMLAGICTNNVHANRNYRKDGSVVHCEWYNSALINEKGELESVQSLILDVTARQQAEQRLAADFDTMERLQQLGAMSIASCDLEPILTEIVDAAIAITHADFGNIQLCDPSSGDLRIMAHRGFPKWWLDFWDSVQKGKGACGRALEQGGRVIVEDVEHSPIFVGTPALDIQRKAGVRAVQSTPLISQSGKIVGMLSTHYNTPRRPEERELRLLDILSRQAADIIAHHQDETALRVNEEFITKAFRAIPDALVISRLEDGKIVEVSDNWDKTFGYNREEVIGKSSLTFNLFADPADRNRAIAFLREQGFVRDYELQIRQKAGAIRTCLLNMELIEIQGKEHILTIVHDITERKRLEDDLRKSDEIYRIVADNTYDWEWWLSPSREYIYNSPSFEAMTGFKVIDFKTENQMVNQIVHPDDRELVRRHSSEVLEKKAASNMEFRIVRLDGEVRWINHVCQPIFDDNGGFIGTRGSNRDITNRKRMEERVKRLETFEVMGRIAGGVAHDLNNILGVSVGYSDLLAGDAALPERMRNSLRRIKESGERAAAIIQDLLTMTGKGAVIRETMSLNDTITDYIESKEHVYLEFSHSGVQVNRLLDRRLLNISGSEIHLYKLVMNLVINAVEATSKGGTVSVTTENAYLESPIQGYELIPTGEYAVLTVSDTGEGISSWDMPHIFEPFYTTKKMKMSGSGLGLSVVWGVVKDHDGFVDVQSKKGKGTTFLLYFPGKRVELSEREVNRRISPEYMGHGEKILVVDDEPWQCEMAAAMLKPLNYNVKTVSSGEEAVEYLKTDKADLIVLDMLMEPGMDGLDTYREAIQLHPGQKAIIVSGFSETERSREAQRLGAGPFVRKPYIQEWLGMEVRKELDRA